MKTLNAGDRVVVVGGGPGGLVTAKALMDEGFDPVVLEGSAAIGGQWNTKAEHSGIWEGMRTNTSQLTTAFSELPHEAGLALFPTALQIGEYLQRYADTFGVSRRVRTGCRVEEIDLKDGGGYTVRYRNEAGSDDIEAAGVVVATGRYNKPNLPLQIEGLSEFSGRSGLLTAFDYLGHAAFAGQRVLMLGNNISALEIASELAFDPTIEVVSACRKPRYIILKITAGIPSDWRFFNRAAVCIGRTLPPPDAAEGMRQEILRLFGNPAAYGGLAPSENLMAAGIAQAQHYLALVAEGRITARSLPTKIDGDTVTYDDGSSQKFDAIIAGTGYQLNLPFLSDSLKSTLKADDERLDLFAQTFHPEIDGLAFVGQFHMIGPYFPVLELQGRWIAMVLAGQRPLPSREVMEQGMEQARMLHQLGAPLVYHELATDLAMTAGVEPDPEQWSDLAGSLIFGPITPAQYRLNGHGSCDDAIELLQQAMAAAGQGDPPPPVTEEQLGLLHGLSQVPDAWPGVASALRALGSQGEP